MSAVAAGRARAIAIPAWVWLAGIVLVSAAIRIALARRMVAPWIMIDEIVYSDLAKSFAAHGSLLIRGVPSHGYGFVYPIVIAPAYRLYAAVPDAYAAAKAINGVVMSLCALAYLARQQAVALFAAAATAPILLALVERRGRSLRAFGTLYGILAAAAAVALLATVARGHSVYSLLGAYRAATTETYTAS